MLIALRSHRFGHVSSIRGSESRHLPPGVLTRRAAATRYHSSRGPGGAQSGAGASRGFRGKLVAAFSAGTVAERLSFSSLHGPDSLQLDRNAVPESGTGREAFDARPAPHALAADEVATRFATDAALELWLISNRSSIPSWPRSTCPPYEANLSLRATQGSPYNMLTCSSIPSPLSTRPLAGRSQRSCSSRCSRIRWSISSG